MTHHSRSILATLVVLAYAGLVHAGSSTTQNLTIFSDTPAASAQAVLRQHASRYGLPVTLDNLVLTKVQESLTGKHYVYQQMLRGIPVDRAEIIVSIGNDGKLQKIFNETVHIAQDVDANAVNQLYVQARISSDQALERGWANMKVQHPLVAPPGSTLVWVKTKAGVQLAEKVQIEAQMPTGGFVQYINAHTGELVDSYSTSLPRNQKNSPRTLAERAALPGPVLDRAEATAKAKAAARAKREGQADRMSATLAPSGINGSGFVFDPDPRTTLNTDVLTDTSPASAFEPAYFNMPLRDLTVNGGVYTLSGPYVNITDIESPNTVPSTTSNGAWTAKRGNDAFDDTNVYFQLDQNQRYIQSLGFTGARSIINRPLDVDTNGLSGDDNSHYSSGGASDYLAFGHGCVNDSEDADVILHEYGHAIHHNINANWSGGDTGAMGEGFGDYWAASYSYSTPNGKAYHPEWVFSWDGHGSCWSGRLTNRTNARYNSTRTYSAHQDVTENGATFQSDELWSAPLYESMVALIAAGKPRANIDKIILEAHFGLGSNIRMPVMATAIVNTARTLYPSEPIYEDTFRAKFTAQNILGGVVVPPGPAITETEDNGTIGSANILTVNNSTVSAVIGSNSDVDYFKITIPAGKSVNITMTPNARADYDLELYDGAGTKLGSSINGTGSADSVSRNNATSVTAVVYAKVYRYSGGVGATDGKYTLNAVW